MKRLLNADEVRIGNYYHLSLHGEKINAVCKVLEDEILVVKYYTHIQFSIERTSFFTFTNYQYSIISEYSFNRIINIVKKQLL